MVAEYLLPLLNPQGQALLYCGQWGSQDGNELNQACLALGAKLLDITRRELPRGRGTRHAIRLVPHLPCPSHYPRAVGIPARQPLGRN